GRVNLGGGVNSFGTTIGPIVVAFALFGTTAAITDEKIASLGLSKVIILYSGVGVLFIAAAALFFFSKKVPAGISTEKIESENKALYSLLIMTGLLIVMFVPVFKSYNSPEQKRIEAIEKSVGDQNKVVDSTIKVSLTNLKDTMFAKDFLKDKSDDIINRQIDSLSELSNEPSYTSAIASVKNVKSQIDTENKEANSLKHPLETYRMK